MLESVLGSNVIYYVMVAAAIGGVVSKVIVSVSLKRLVRAASNMPKSTHSFMKLVRAKFEHACMVNDKVENVGVFVDKYIAEYQVMRIKLHTWQRVEKMLAIFVAVLAGVALGINYYYAVGSEAMMRNGVIGGMLVLVLIGVYQLVDEKYRLSALRMYMVDYLENVCVRKYGKINGGQAIQVPFATPNESREPRAEEQLQYQKKMKKRQRLEPIGQAGYMEYEPEENRYEAVPMRESEGNKVKQQEDMVNEGKIREILQEFMA